MREKYFEGACLYKQLDKKKSLLAIQIFNNCITFIDNFVDLQNNIRTNQSNSNA